MSEGKDLENYSESNRKSCLMISRRAFLLAGAATVVTTVLLPGFKGEASVVKTTGYPKELIGKLSALKEGRPVPFEYPKRTVEQPRRSTIENFMVKLGVPAGGGIGKDQDVVAFNTLCPHLGGPLSDLYKHEHKAVGPCPFHLSTFDLTRFGIIISGHAVESLPQVILSLEGDDIYATGFMGLVYGRSSNI